MSSQKAKDEGKEDQIHLRRSISLVPAVSFIVGSMIGSGIFIAPKGVHMNTGSVGLSLLVWALCGLLSTFGRLQKHLHFCTEICATTITQITMCLYCRGLLGKWEHAVPSFIGSVGVTRLVSS